MTDPPCLCKDVKAHRIQNNFMIHFLSWKISNSQQVNFFSGQVWNTKATKDYHCVYNKLFFLAYSKTFIMTDPPCKAHRSKQAHWFSDEVDILRGFMKFFFKQILKVSAFYLEKQTIVIPKKNIFQACSPKQKSFVYQPNFQGRF